MIQLLGQFPGSLQVNIDFFNYVDRQTNSTGLVHQPTFYGLTDPLGGISRKTKTPLGIKFFHCTD